MRIKPTSPYPGMHTASFDEHDKHTLGNCLRTAAERFKEHAETFRALIDHTPDPNAMMQIHGEGARIMADQFEEQAREALAYADVFENADVIGQIIFEAEEEPAD
jgi:hypothetical protein